ncbi:HD-GYP domain-containing protein [Sideroxydans lithotrophicus]|uniref:Metal dependent phosphohydrolase n=1 Tax=Sideroxydans lithotrophicus (strain ES-1) TaxID=580332 RepID=D5CLF3_SIDLE|nr:HD-GYP domain-containing protein [Sideroxydans lithotrophicus]ADE10541.1 metal dependent phosphohydrolase [Sideroxydans lithotrophicus ES-1]
MQKNLSATSEADSFVTACEECGTASHERQYVRILNRHTCEHCLLDSRKRSGGLETEPYEKFVESLAEALDLREKETGLHSKRVATHTLLLATHHYKKVTDLREVYWGSLLHDIGKIGVPDAILLKPGKLSDEEWKIMQEHPRNGHRILQNLPFLSMASNIVLCHEERFDGSGYPAGLKGEEIPLAARLFAVIDTLDAMTFDRPYRKGLPFDTAKAEIIRMAGSQFDPRAVESFLREEQALREMTDMEYPAAHFGK